MSLEKSIGMLTLVVQLASSFVTLNRNGSVALSVDGTSWLQSDEVLLRTTATSDSPSLFTTLDGSLNLVKFSTDHQEIDILGAYNATRWSWAANTNVCSGGVVFETEARVYGTEHHPSKVVFKQSFPCALNTTTTADNWLISEFPSFRSAAKTTGFDRVMTFNDHFARGHEVTSGLRGCSVTTQGGVPIALFQSKGNLIGSTLVFSQLTKMKTAEMYCGAPKSSLDEKRTAGKPSCRILTQKMFNVITSKGGYDAYVPDSIAGSSDRNYTKHYKNYCNDSHVWAYEGNDDTPSCQRRCDGMNCTCFDALDHNPPTPPPTPPTPGPSGPGALALGLKGTLVSIPAGFEAEWVVVLGQKEDGILGSLEKWGNALLTNSGKRGGKRWGPYDDPISSYVGWWTDNGGYYHYGGTDPAKSGDYEVQMARVRAEQTEADFPVKFKHWQLDSWWYPKGVGGNGSYNPHKSGVYQWVADPFVFPHGIPALQKMVQLPFIMHNRWYHPSNWYRTTAKVGGEWVGNDNAVLPLDLQDFWSFFFTQQDGFGIAVYEQDFMFTQYDNVAALRENATFADDWLDIMAKEAAKKDLTMQYCMPYPREYLKATEHENVITIRASDDYHAGRDNWKISRSSLLAHSVGLLPFKDTFYTNTAQEKGGADSGVEVNALLQTAVATLSASIVGPGDGLGYLNATTLMRCCRSDGLVLKAERPAVALDAQWSEGGGGGAEAEISWTYTCPHSIGSGSSSVFYLLAASVDQEYVVTPVDFEAGAKCATSAPMADQFIVYDWNKNAVISTNFSTDSPLLLSRSQHTKSGAVDWSLYIVSPVVDGWALIGDSSKFVGTSSQRIASTAATATGASAGLVVNALGAAGESVEVCAWESATQALVCKSGTANAQGHLQVNFNWAG
jgi:hypothetical protein